jgi:predicted metal-dependent hydrolase
MSLTPQKIKNLYAEAFGIFGEKLKIPEIEIEFYPYVNVNSRIRSREGLVSVRIAELLSDAPAAVHRALARILVAKLLGKKVPPKARQTYREFLHDENFQKKAVAHKRRTGRKELTTPQGKCFDLEKLFHKLNLVYFQNEIPKPDLSWSKRKTYRRLGHHDPVHNAIIISRSLDARSVPKYVVEYVLYHEMLHIKHPVYQRNGRRFIHTAEFRRDEEKFPYFEDAERWIDENAERIKRKVRRSLKG